MIKQPKRLTASVPHGKNVLLGDFISVEMMYRIAPPMKLPMPTINIDFSILGFMGFLRRYFCCFCNGTHTMSGCYRDINFSIKLSIPFVAVF